MTARWASYLLKGRGVAAAAASYEASQAMPQDAQR